MRKLTTKKTVRKTVRKPRNPQNFNLTFKLPNVPLSHVLAIRSVLERFAASSPIAQTILNDLNRQTKGVRLQLAA